LDNFFFHIYQYLDQHRRIAWFILLAAISLLALLGSRVSFEEDISKLIPVDEEHQDLKKVLNSVKFKDKIIVNISIGKEGDINDLTAYASAYLDSLEAHPEFRIVSIQGRSGDEDMASVMEFAYENAPLLLEESDYEKIAAELEDDSIKEKTKSNFRTLISPSGIIVKKGILRDPLGISFIALEKLKQLSLGDDFTMHEGFLVNVNKTNLLLFISPGMGSTETGQNELLVNYLHDLDLDLASAFAGKAKSQVFGSPLVAVANAHQIKHDINLTVGIAMLLLLLIFILFYRNVSVPLLLFTPSIFGALLAIAILVLIRDEISAISLGIGAVLIGITLDYSLHILTHLRIEPDVRGLYKDVSRPILMSSLTTSLAFACLLLIDSQALQDLGLFAGISVLGASCFALIFIPLVYRPKQVERPRMTLLDKVAAYPIHKNRWAAIGLILLTLICMFQYDQVIFDKDLNNLNFFPVELQQAEKDLDALTDFSSRSIYFCTYDDSLQTAIETNGILFQMLRTMEQEGKIKDFSSIGGIVLSKAAQEKRIARWKSFWVKERIDATRNSLITHGSELGFNPETFSEFYMLLDKDFKTLGMHDYDALSLVHLDDFLSEVEGFNTITTLVKVSDEQEAALKASFKGMDHVLAIDRKEMNEIFLGDLKNEFNELILYSFIVVTLILLIFYRDIPMTLVTLIPVCLTWFLTIGLMAFLGISFNIFNIIISTFIFGLGIDYSIFISNGLLRSLRTGENNLSTYRTSILLSLLTTVLGIGVLVFAEHPALYTISVVCMIGVISAVLMSFTLQPILFEIFIGSKTKAPTRIRELLYSIFSFTYFGIGAFIFSILSVTLIPLLPLSKKLKFKVFHKFISTFFKSVLYTNPFLKKRIINVHGETFEKPGMIIANHTSFSDILSLLMLHPRIIILVNDWVYNSPIFGKVVKMGGFYPVSSGIQGGVLHLRQKVAQGYNLMAFPEGTRSLTNKIKRFHKGAFYLAEQMELDVIPLLIHGNSEVLPKNQYVIQDGAINIEILARIPFGSKEYGENSRTQTRKISAYFKAEYDRARRQYECEDYFHRMVIEHYRYSDFTSYKALKNDLKKHAKSYQDLSHLIGPREVISCFTEGAGHWAILLLCDEPERTVHLYMDDKDERDYLRERHLTARTENLHIPDKIDVMSNISSKVVILDSNNCTFENSPSLITHEMIIVFLDQEKRLGNGILEMGLIELERNECYVAFGKKKG